MKELSQAEISNVSGGLLLIGALTSSCGSKMGDAIGTIVDVSYKMVGVNTNFAQAGATLGGGIGHAVGLNPFQAISGIGKGVMQIIDNAYILQGAGQQPA